MAEADQGLVELGLAEHFDRLLQMDAASFVGLEALVEAVRVLHREQACRFERRSRSVSASYCPVIHNASNGIRLSRNTPILYTAMPP